MNTLNKFPDTHCYTSKISALTRVLLNSLCPFLKHCFLLTPAHTSGHSPQEMCKDSTKETAKFFA